MSERKDFELRVNNQDYVLRLGNCAVNLFINEQEKDYLYIEAQEELPAVRLFLNQGLVRWMAGIAINPDSEYMYVNTYWNHEDGRETVFREEYGWNPPVLIREEPSEREREMFIEVSTDDGEWK